MRKQMTYLMIATLALAATAGAAIAASGATITLISEFDYPISGISVWPQSINNNGAIVGYATVIMKNSSGTVGFKRLPDGTFVTLRDPASNMATAAFGINDSGEIVGSYEVAGFTLVDGVYSDFLGAPAECAGQPCPGDLYGINDRGDLVGAWFPSPGVSQAFAVLNGIFTPITNAFLANADGVGEGISNNSTHVVGTSSSGAFLYSVSSGAITQIYYPGSNATDIYGVNNQGTATGRYTDANGLHGLARIAGQWATYDFPGAHFTALLGVNDNNVATGYYIDPVSGVLHGLILQVALAPAT